MKNLTIYFILFSGWLAVSGQDMLGPKTNRAFNVLFSWTHYAQTKDYFMGFELGTTTPVNNLSIFGTFDFRPYKKKVLVHQDGNLFYQFSEQRFVAGGGLDYLVPLNEKGQGLFINMEAGYLFGSYAGALRKPEQGWILIPKAGFYWELMPSTGYLKAGYGYLDSKSEEIGPHRLYISFTGIFR